MPQSTIHIAVNIDSRFTMQCCTMLTSLARSNKGVGLHVYVIEAELDADGRGQVERCARKLGINVTFLHIDRGAIADRLRTFDGHITEAAYYRLFTARLLPEELDKVIYLDCDLIVVGSLMPLWETDITGHPVGCVEDQWSGKPDYYERLGYDSRWTYFNSGVLLINLDWWRRYDTAGQALDILATHDALRFYDQDVLNILFHESKLLLPYRYNVQDGFLRRRPKIMPASLDAMRRDIREPVVIHFTGAHKPWQYRSVSPYKPLFLHFLDQTQWAGTRPEVPTKYKLRTILYIIMYALRLKPRKYIKVNMPELQS